MNQPNQHLVTIIDVARAAGVSKSTVGRVLAGNGSVSAAAFAKVTAAAKQLGYSPNGLAKAMVSGASHTLGVVIPDISSPFFSTVVRGISDAARAAGFEVLLSNSDGDPDIETRSLEVLVGQRVAGLIVAPVFQGGAHTLADIAHRGIPVVMLDRETAELRNSSLVSLDHVAASRIGVEHLIGLGHRRIGIVTEAGREGAELPEPGQFPRPLQPSSQRLLGYIEALKEHGIEVDPELIIHAEYDRSSAAAAVRTALAEHPDMTALFCTDAALTSGAYEAVAELDIRYPENLSFVGFDDQEWSTLVRPAITVVAQPRHKLGATTATCLIEAIRRPNTPTQNILLPARLIVRGSTAPLP